MVKYKYIGEIFKQGDSEQEIISFCAPAEDIKKWGGVPTKTERFHGGFQRALTDRYKKIIEFFENEQISPTSVVIAFREGTLAVDPLGHPSAWPPVDNLSHAPEYAQISFDVEEYDLESVTIEELCNKVCSLLACRIRDNEIAENAETDEFSEDESEEVNDLSESEDSEFEEDYSETIDVGHSKLIKFYKFISDTRSVNEWLAEQEIKYDEIKKKQNKSKKDREFIEYTPIQKLSSLLVSLLKPGMIVDGQHRVEGASNASTEEPILFSVCAIKDAGWVEQVFQFVVINKLAKPISGSFLTSIMNTSLTNEEIDVIEPRLEQIGIKNIDRIIMNYINFDERSPFFGMVTQPGEILGVDNSGRLSDKGMLRIAKTWRGVSSNKNRFKMFYDCLESTTNKAKQKSWVEENRWVEYFYEFWNVIKELYEDEHLWISKSKFHLLMIVTMVVLQDNFLEKKSSAKVKFKNMKDFKEQVREFYEDVPGAFFIDWKRTGLQSGDGQKIILSAINDLINGAKLSKLKDESPLFLEI